MTWFRLSRSLRTYIILGLIITITIITFSTSKILRIDASDPKPTFQFLVANHKQQQQQQSSFVGDGFGFTGDGGTRSPDNGLNSGKSLSPSLLSHQRLSDGSISEPNIDYHTTSVDLMRNSSNLLPAASVHSQNFNQPEINSDTLIISPAPASTALFSVNKDSKRSDANQATSDKSSNLNGTPQAPNNLENLSLYFSPYNTSTFGRSMSESSWQNVEQVEFRRNFIKDMMRHAWRGYANYAWGYNEVRPVSKAPHTEGIFGGEKLGASIVDGIDTLYIMGLTDEYLAARTWIENNLDFNKFDLDLSVFETNIRYVGGLLSIYALTKDQMFLNKAVHVADKLLPAFDTPSGIPHSNVNLKTGFSRNHDWAYGAAILSELGSMHLEFIYLSHATGDPKYQEKVLRIREAIRKAVPRPDGLYNNYMNTDTGQWLARPTHISMGALGDSFYEYLIKAYIQSDGQDVEAYQMYIDAIDAFEKKLTFISSESKLLYFAELKDTTINPKMDSLACFSGGMLATGANVSRETIKSRHMTLASGVANTCHESCIRAKSHLGPETFMSDAKAYGPSEKYYLLRPEIIETYFYMWRYTHDPKYRSWAWDFTEALERHCKSEAGYSGLRNVYHPVIKDDVQQSFFLAEVLKYLYLIFSDDKTISLNHWVFNTESHPLPILRKS